MSGSGESGGVTAQRLRKLAGAARRAQESARDTETARNAAIGEAEAGGWSIGEIAKAAEMSRAHVHRIVVACAADQQEQAETD